MVDRDGDPIAWHGFQGYANEGSDLPYLVCQLHSDGFQGEDEDPDWTEEQSPDAFPDRPGYDDDDSGWG